MAETPDRPKSRPEEPSEPTTAIEDVVACLRCASTSQQLLHDAPRLTLFKCADCGWRYALSR